LCVRNVYSSILAFSFPTGPRRPTSARDQSPTRASVSEFLLLIILGLRSFKFLRVLVYFPHVRSLDHHPVCVLDPSPALLLYFVFEWTVSYHSFVFLSFSRIFIVSLFVSSLPTQFRSHRELGDM
jgi:hypothetical protein